MPEQVRGAVGPLPLLKSGLISELGVGFQGKKKSASMKAAPGESRVRGGEGAIGLQSDVATVLSSNPASPQGDWFALPGIHGRVLRQANLSRSHSPRDLEMC